MLRKVSRFDGLRGNELRDALHRVILRFGVERYRRR